MTSRTSIYLFLCFFKLFIKNSLISALCLSILAVATCKIKQKTTERETAYVYANYMMLYLKVAGILLNKKGLSSYAK